MLYNHATITNFQIERDADVNARDVYGDIPVFDAIHSNSHQTLELLLVKGAISVNSNEAGDTVLHIAARYADEESLELLLRFGVGGVDTSAVNRGGRTADDFFHSRGGCTLPYLQELWADILCACSP